MNLPKYVARLTVFAMASCFTGTVASQNTLHISNVRLGMSVSQVDKVFDRCNTRNDHGKLESMSCGANSNKYKKIVVDVGRDRLVKISSYKKFEFQPEWNDIQGQIIDRYGSPSKVKSAPFNNSTVKGFNESICYGDCKTDGKFLKISPKGNGLFATFHFEENKETGEQASILTMTLVDEKKYRSLRNSVRDREEEAMNKRKKEASSID